MNGRRDLVNGELGQQDILDLRLRKSAISIHIHYFKPSTGIGFKLRHSNDRFKRCATQRTIGVAHCLGQRIATLIEREKERANPPQSGRYSNVYRTQMPGKYLEEV
jgi:hypothetical protein